MDGTYQIFLQQRDGPDLGPFSSPYELTVSDFKIADDDKDGILEFGENITLRNIAVRNIGSMSLHYPLMLGGMPSPRSTDSITMKGAPTDWLQPTATRLKVPPLILSRATAQVEGTLSFLVKRPDTLHGGEPYVVVDRLCLQGHMSKLRRQLPNFHSGREIVLRYPIEISRPQYLRSLPAGHETMVTFTVNLFQEVYN